MPGVGQKILASDFNSIQTLAQTVLGNGSGQYGYGQPVTSTQVRAGDPFLLLDWVNLRTDLLKIGAHISGNASEGNNLTIPGNLDPRNINSFISKTGAGPFLVTFGFTATPGNIVPSIGAPYKIQGCANTNYNGVYESTASSASTITLKYNNDPGQYSNIKIVKISSVLTEIVRQQYFNYAQAAYASANQILVSITGTTNASTTMSSANAAIIMLGATISGPGMATNTTITGVLPGTSLTLSIAAQNTTTGGTFGLTLINGVKTVAANQLSPNEPITSVTRTVAWNGNIQTVATCTFPTVDSARAFFNSGSQFEISPSLSGSFGSGSTLKDQTWQTMFTQIGTICFRANDCIQTPTDYSPTPSTHYPIGWYGMTTADRLIFSKQAPSGSYSANVLNVYGRVDGTGKILTLTIRFQDDAAGAIPYGIDENVDGILTVNFTATRASGSNVSVVTPPVNLTAIA
jgi:hypothetical protein